MSVLIDATRNETAKTLTLIREKYRRIKDYEKVEIGLLQRQYAIIRRATDCGKDDAPKIHKALWQGKEIEKGEKLQFLCEHFEAARLNFIEHKKPHIREIEKLIKKLPVWEWAKSVRGCGPYILGQLLAETGDLSDYANPAKVWKRMGLAVINGERQRKCLDKEKAIIHGYCPRRRSIMWNLGKCLIRSNDQHFRRIYDERKEYEEGKAPEKSKAAWDIRAQRYMEKAFLRELWEEWNRA